MRFESKHQAGEGRNVVLDDVSCRLTAPRAGYLLACTANLNLLGWGMARYVRLVFLIDSTSVF